VFFAAGDQFSQDSVTIVRQRTTFDPIERLSPQGAREWEGNCQQKRHSETGHDALPIGKVCEVVFADDGRNAAMFGNNEQWCAIRSNKVTS